MTNSQKLRKIIEKAVKNGWNKDGCSEIYISFDGLIFGKYKDNYKDVVKERIIPLETIIFKHDFCKAYFGEKHNWYESDYFYGYYDKCKNCGQTRKLVEKETSYNCWKHCIQALALSEDRIEYLYKHL
jgi:hypothetical protein